MTHDHDHDHRHGQGAPARVLAGVLALTAFFMVVEVVAGFLTNSLALLSDAGHMLTDSAALALSLVAAWFSMRPVTPQKTFGFYRVEILAALANGVALILITALIAWEAFQRLLEPQAVQSLPMMAVAALGLGVNGVSLWLLHRFSEHNLNVKGAFLHVMGDALGSMGAIAAALIMWQTQWWLADPILSIGIAILIVRSAWKLVNQSLHILLEGVPLNLSLEEIAGTLAAEKGVVSVHDLHVWTVASGFVCLSGHVSVAEGHSYPELLKRLRQVLHDQFHIHHVTLQLEEPGLLEQEEHWQCFGGSCPIALHHDSGHPHA